jgi:spoIIIJ-associated protein
MTEAWNDSTERAVAWLSELLDLMELGAKVGAEAREDGSGAILRVTGGRAAELLENGGRGFEALELLLQRTIPRVTGRPEFRAELDVEGCRQARVERLMRAAREAAEQVKATGRPFEFEPMPAADRKVIHNTLRYIPGLKTESGLPDENGLKRLTVRADGAPS